MLRAYKYRIYPTDEQKVLLAKTFGCCRFVYNWALKLKIEVYEHEKKSVSYKTVQDMMVNELKKDKQWLNEVNSQALPQIGELRSDGFWHTRESDDFNTEQFRREYGTTDALGVFLHQEVLAWIPIPSFDDILEANRDVLERIKEKGD